MACPTDPPAGPCGAITACLYPLPPCRIGQRLGEKKAQGPREGAFLDGALAAFAGYVAADELYEGPSCVLSAVDKRQDKRMLYQVLDHEPTHDARKAFLGRLKAALDGRGLALKGITTDGSALSPDAIREVCGEVPHQLCPFPVIAAWVKGVLRAVASERERVAPAKPQLPRGRPSSKDQAARRLARKSQWRPQTIRAGFQERFLFVKRRLKPSERQRFMHITRGLPHLRKLREIIEPI